MWYKAVRLLNVSSLGLESLRSKNFDYAENLVTLIASHNELTEISQLLFDDAKKISVVDLSFNKIIRIDPMAFYSENNITLLNLSNNLIAKIENQTFLKLSQLEVLNLSFNLMTDIPEGLFDTLIQLKHLNLGKNFLKQLKCSIFTFMSNLNILDLTANKLQVFDTNCVQSEKSFALLIEGNELSTLSLSRNVSEINASTNNITKIFTENGLDNMTVFNISKNNVGNILELIQKLSPQLRILDVSDSPIGRLNVSTFQSFDSLEYLSLRNTNLSNIQYGTFHHQQKLRYLDLSNNDLKKINFGMLRWNSALLEKLYLDDNTLDDLSNLTKSNYPSLEYVSIDSNNFDCDYLSEIQQLWKREGISLVSNPHINPELQATDTHINGITCYHDSLASKLQIIDGDKECEREGGKEVYSAASTSTSSVTETLSMWKIELLLTCIVIVLICLLVIAIIKNFVPVFKIPKRADRIESEPIYYRPKVEEQSLL